MPRLHSFSPSRAHDQRPGTSPRTSSHHPPCIAVGPSEIGWMSMGIVDTVMVGHLPDSARAIGSVSISSNLFNVLAFFGGGLLIGIDTLVAQAFGAGKREDCHRSLVNSIYLSMVMTPFLMTAV